MPESMPHRPVMAEEVLRYLNLRNGYIVLDGTIGCGGHAIKIIEKIMPRGLLIGIDLDNNSLKIAKSNLVRFNANLFKLIKGNFKDADFYLSKLGIKKINACLLDLGISSYQLNSANRGFSFELNGPIDMRMDLSKSFKAYDIINKFKRKELEKIVKQYGEERHYRRIVNSIVKVRRIAPIRTTGELSEIIIESVRTKYRKQKIHPATRTYQALRIAVNDELNNLNDAIPKIVNMLDTGGRFCIISFHSLEDRIVKLNFKTLANKGIGKILTKKPLKPDRDEVIDNIRARSARMRVLERI